MESPELKTRPKQPRFAKCDAEWLALPLAGRDLRALLALSLYADWRKNGHGRCFPKRETLASATNLQVSHVSEAVRTLADAGLITVVRLGRKNIYYVRPIGETYRMPPSHPVPFFRYLFSRGIHLSLTSKGELRYDHDSKKLDDVHPLLRAILTDYVNGLTQAKLRDAIESMSAPPDAKERPL